MKKVVVLFIVLSVLLSFTGCVFKDTSVIVYSHSCELLYDENGEAVMTWVYDYSTLGYGWIYELSRENDEYYAHVNSSHRKHNTKMRIIENELIGTCINVEEEMDSNTEYPHLSSYKSCFKTPKNGDNAYKGEQVVNLYYLDQDKTKPVLAVTDEIGDEVRTILINALEGSDGEKFFVFSNGDGDYNIFNIDPDNPEKILSELPEYSLVSNTANMYVKYLIQDVENFSTRAEVEGLAEEPVEFEVVMRSSDFSYMLKIPTVDDQFIKVKFDRVPLKPDEDSSLVVQKKFYKINQMIIIPRDVIKY